ncbi:MAG: ATP synthase F1 subunit gamma [Acidobacteria bacterium]|nr:ATP synthase F1 subunit gamma [Acidobacteriota bacterium]MCA1609889.1 ATP synthase F1 subunit gamma [Acidobacteriota bacterium]
MASLIDIRRRLRSVKNTQQITKAMKMISAARLRRAQERAVSARPYARILREVLAKVSSRVREIQHPLLAEREEKNVAVLVVSGDRGLAGGFNSNINRAVLQLLSEKGWESVTLLPIGKKAVEFARRRRAKIAEKSYPGIFSKVEYATAQEIAAGLSAEFSEGKIDAAYVVFNEFKSVISQAVRVERLLPISRAQAALAEAPASEVEPIFEPDPATILARILPRYLEFAIYRILLESGAAEHAARMTAMDSASNNAGDMIDSLTLTYNRVRQARITKELIEIVSGASALE